MRQHFLTHAALATWAIIACEFGMADDDDAPADAQHPIAQVKLDQAIELQRTWHASFETLRFEYRWSKRAELREPFPERADTPEKLDGWYGVTKCWLTKGMLERTEELTFKNGRRSNRRVAANTGQFAFMATYDGESEFPKALSATPNPIAPQAPRNAILGLLGDGLYFSPDESHGDRIMRFSGQPIGLREILGSACVGYRFDPPSRTVTWLDLDHDGLERLVTVADEKYPSRWECLEFQHLPSGHWFPKRVEVVRGTSSPDDIYEINVTEVAVNEVFDSQLFEPPGWNEQTKFDDRAGGVLNAPPRRGPGAQTITVRGIWRLFSRWIGRNLWLIPPLVFAIAWGIHAWWRRGRVGASGDKQ